jgi:hypothetical protein
LFHFFASLSFTLLSDSPFNAEDGGARKGLSDQHAQHRKPGRRIRLAKDLRLFTRTVSANASQPLFAFVEDEIKIYVNETNFLIWSSLSIDELNSQFMIWSYKPLLTWIFGKTLLRLAFALLLEPRVLVYGDVFEDIVKTVLFIAQLISPFTWMTPLCTIFVAKDEAILDSVMNSMFGCIAMPPPVLFESYLVIDLSKKMITFPQLPKLPFDPSEADEIATN